MATDIYAGRCRDCFKKHTPLRILDNPALAKHLVRDRELCEKCYTARERDLDEGSLARPFGIPAHIEGMRWIDINPITLIPSSGVTEYNPAIVTISKIRLPIDMTSNVIEVADVRMCIGENKHWEATGDIDLTIPALRRNPKGYALSSIRIHLERRFAPHMVLRDDESIPE